MHQTPENFGWYQVPAQGAAIQQQWAYGPADSSQQVHVPIVRKQTAPPNRKPVGEAAFAQPGLNRGNSSATTVSRQSVYSTTGSVSSVSSAGTVSQGIPWQPQQPIVKQLPPGWQICHDERGRVYFLNTVNNLTSWEPPESKILTPITYAPVQLSSAPIHHNSAQVQTASIPQLIQRRPVSVMSPQSRTSPTATLAPQQSSDFVPPTQSFSPTSFLPSQQVPAATFSSQCHSVSPTSTNSTQSPAQAPFQTIPWESSQCQSQPGRRQSRLSLPNGVNVPNVSTIAMKNGAKKAGETSLKTAKVVGNAIVKNRKLIGAGLKLTNVILKNTTGAEIPGSDWLSNLGDGSGDGVLAAAGAVGDMLGGDSGSFDVDMDIGSLGDDGIAFDQVSVCDVVEVDVDQVSLGDSGSLEVESEVVDIYGDSDSVDYQDQCAPSMLVPESTFQPQTMPVFKPRKPMRKKVNGTVRPPNQASSHPATTGKAPIKSIKGRQPVQNSLVIDKSEQLRPVTAQRTKQMQKVTSSTGNRSQHGKPTSAQMAVRLGEAQLLREKKAQSARPPKIVQRHPQSTAQVAPSDQAFISKMTISALKTATKIASNKEVRRGFKGIFRDDACEGSSSDEECDYDENNNSTEDLQDDEDEEEQYESQEMEAEGDTDTDDQNPGTTLTMTSNSINGGDLSAETAHIDYSSLDGGFFYGGNNDCATDEEPPIPTEASQETTICAASQQEATSGNSFSMENAGTSAIFEENVNSTSEINVAQPIQDSQSFQIETFAEDYSITTSVSQTEVLQRTDMTVPNDFGVSQYQITSEISVQPQALGQQPLALNFLQPCRIDAPPEPPRWAENAILEENVWADETPSQPPAQSKDAWSAAGTWIVQENTQLSSCQEDSIDIEGASSETTESQQEVSQQDIPTFTEPEPAIFQSSAREEAMSSQFVVDCSSLEYQKEQLDATDETVITAEVTISQASSLAPVFIENTVFGTVSAAVTGPAQDEVPFEAISAQETTQVSSCETFCVESIIDYGPHDETVVAEAMNSAENGMQQEIVCNDLTISSTADAANTAQTSREVTTRSEILSCGKLAIESETQTEHLNPEISRISELATGTGESQTYTSTTDSTTTFFIDCGIINFPSAQTSLELEASIATTPNAAQMSTTSQISSQTVLRLDTSIAELDTEQLEPKRGGSEDASVSEKEPAISHRSQTQVVNLPTESIIADACGSRNFGANERYVMEYASCIETSLVEANATRQTSERETNTRQPGLVRCVSSQDLVKDGSSIERKSIETAVIEIASQDESFALHHSVTVEANSVWPPVIPETEHKDIVHSKEVAIVISPPAEVHQHQPIIIENLPYVESKTVEQEAPTKTESKGTVVEIDPSSENNSCIRKGASTTQRFSDISQTCIVYADIVPADEKAVYLSSRNILDPNLGTSLMLEEERSYQSPSSNTHYDEQELFMNNVCRTSTESSKPAADRRTRRSTAPTTQLKEFLQQQSLIFQAASAVDRTISESAEQKDTVQEEVAHIKRLINAKPPPPYPLSPRRKSIQPVQPVKSSPACNFSPPSPPPKVLRRSFTDPTSDSNADIPIKSLKAILHEAVAAQHQEGHITPCAVLPHTAVELPALNDAREEPNIIGMTAQESYAMAMFSSGNFLGSDFGFGDVFEEEDNMLPEVKIGH